METQTYLLCSAILQANTKHAAPDIRVDCRPIAGSKLRKHVLSGSEDFLVACTARSAEHHGFELLLDVSVTVGEHPARGMAFGADEVALEPLERVPDCLVLEDPGALDGA